jgi:hypothetical protein
MTDQRKKTPADEAAAAEAPTTPDEAENTDDTLRVANRETANATAEKLTTEQVRQGHTGDHVRYILAASITGIGIIFAIAYFYFVQ